MANQRVVSARSPFVRLHRLVPFFAMRPSRFVHIVLWSLIVFMTIHILRMNSGPGDLSDLAASINGDSGDGASDSRSSWLWRSASGGVGGRRVVFSTGIGGKDSHNAGRSRLNEELNDLARSAWRPLVVRPGQHLDAPLLLTRSPMYQRRAVIDNIFQLDATNLSAVREAILEINERQPILNLHLYNKTDYVIAVQVHNRIEYLSLLIQSLRRAKDIHKALVIFSHDEYDADMNRLIRSIGFCKVMQIFLPYSQQLYHNTFPGESPNDCPRNMKRTEALRKKCLNARSPDKYGHYREARYCQTKHHWFWKLNFIFEKIVFLQPYRGLVLFLEEDHYVAEDFLHMQSLMHTYRKNRHSFVDILCLGSYEKKASFTPSSGRYQVGKWVSSFHNMGMAFDRSIWQKIKKCAKQFCNFDDYNWDWSLQFVSMTCIPGNLKVMVLKHSPRVFHIGECGVHHKKKLCSPYHLVASIDKILERNLVLLYPNTLVSLGSVTIRARNPKPNGGWGDVRDRALCKAFVYGPEKDFPVAEGNVL